MDPVKSLIPAKTGTQRTKWASLKTDCVVPEEQASYKNYNKDAATNMGSEVIPLELT